MTVKDQEALKVEAVRYGWKRKAAAQMLADPSDPRHGTMNGYVNRRCRCDRCRDANAAYQRQRRAVRYSAEPTVHGLSSTYTNWGCRCRSCCAAHTEVKRQHRAPRTASTAS